MPHLTDKSGEVANAVFGFSNMLIKALNEVGPRYVACAFDTQAPTFRHIEFEEYKAQRVASPPDLYPQFPKVKKVLDAFGISYFEKEGYEADDLLATLASKLQTPNSKLQTIILSGDRDVLQLVDGNIKVQMPSFTKASEGKPGWGVLVGAKEIKEKYGLESHQMVDYKSLTGDPSDNVPGIAGVGPKTASQLLQKYHTLENLFKHIDRIAEPLRSKLETDREVALAAKKLIELDRNVDLKFEIGNLRFNPDWEKVRREYEGLGFKSIVAKLPQSVHSSQSTVHSKERTVNREPKTDNQKQLKLV
ncbi:MAG: hypothetical protein A2172_03965 [Candidatus Woykebacteria bacterium RBG_13_40_15]|uniref:5'-3' exonuclease domain-containing protein n=1 Tax=Candidatus Woykebacteria bacterium RBG_13_40_15 TaxID=1802593 RepID=A0A1G1W586_9BACT|nr:MAG: hypothetical protein A2172_03965 [Candidatus Woykebacteria bacterium RBG_13_40_15]